MTTPTSPNLDFMDDSDTPSLPHDLDEYSQPAPKAPPITLSTTIDNIALNKSNANLEQVKQLLNGPNTTVENINDVFKRAVQWAMNPSPSIAPQKQKLLEVIETLLKSEKIKTANFNEVLSIAQNDKKVMQTIFQNATTADNARVALLKVASDGNPKSIILTNLLAYLETRLNDDSAKETYGFSDTINPLDILGEAAKNGHLEVVKTFLESGKFQSGQVNVISNAIKFAVQNNHPDIVKELLTSQHINPEDKKSALGSVSKSGALTTQNGFLSIFRWPAWLAKAIDKYNNDQLQKALGSNDAKKIGDCLRTLGVSVNDTEVRKIIPTPQVREPINPLNEISNLKNQLTQNPHPHLNLTEEPTTLPRNNGDHPESPRV